MNINFESLKAEFKEYLESLGIKPKLNEDDELTSASIFTYSKQFKEFINEEYDINLEKNKLNFSELLDNEIKDGKFVLPEENSNNQDENFMLELLNGLFEEEEFAQNIDEDGKDGLSEEEIKKFLTFSNEQNYRDDEEEFSFDDLEKGFQKVEDGKYDASKINLEENEQIEAATSSAGASGGGSAGGGYSGGGGTTNTANTVNTTANTTQDADVDYSQMSKEKLETAYNEQQSTISAKSQNVNTVMTQNQADIAKAKEEYDKAISQDNIDPALLASRDENLNAITQTDTQITQLSTQINDLDVQITSYESYISALDANISGLQAALASLSNAPADDEEAQQAIEQKRADINQQITSLTQDKETKTAEKQKLEAQKQQAQTSLDECNTKLSELETARTEIEQKITQTCNEATKAAIEKYNTARETASTNLQAAKDTLNTEKEKLEEIKTYLYKSYEESMIDEYGYSEKGDVFIPYEGYSEVTDIEKTNMDYKVLMANGADVDKELPVIVFLHGANGSKNSLQNQALNPERLAADGVTTSFNGYIICPTMGGNCETAAQNIDEILNSFSKNHKIDKDNIVLVGYSNGGTYAAGIANSTTFNDGNGYQFSKVALLTGYTKQKTSFNIPVGIWVDGTSTGLKNTIEYDESQGDKFVDWSKSKTHYDMEDDGFREDSNGDGKSDMIQWLFNDE